MRSSSDRAMEIFERMSPHQMAVELAVAQERIDVYLIKQAELLSRCSQVGLDIDKAILIGVVPDQHAIRSRLELLANHRKLTIELADQLEDATQQIGVMAWLLRDLRKGVEVHLHSSIVANNEFGAECQREFLARIDVALAGKLPDHIADATKMVVPEGWQLVPKSSSNALREAYDEGVKIALLSGLDHAEAFHCGYKRMLAAASKPE